MAESIAIQDIVYALLGGILPVLLWLWFWLKEDAKKPEPLGLIALSFVAGMVAVIVALGLEKLATLFIERGTLLLFAWATIEEVVKFSTVILIGLRSRFFDEPVDALVYMITAALGFAALENTLFLIGPLANGGYLESLVTGNLRYIGATLLHVAASGVMGAFIAASFYKGRAVRVLSAALGLFFAIVLHTLFNFFIILEDGKYTFIVLMGLWFVITAIIFLFEQIKKIKPPLSI